ncbi:hypothetical protein CK203_053817 [Vitis vinifera]|uniref:Uncharacterized protein n=1 Tax=Vitis vinifera TaxID=29760 RepID=A0A438GRJ5_VITVI|nr:hypothetical protein CK203_053817 [Vitis vinifera]
MELSQNCCENDDFLGIAICSAYAPLDECENDFAHTSEDESDDLVEAESSISTEIGSSRWGCNYGDACFPNRYGFSKSSFKPLKWQNRWQKLTKYWQLKVIPGARNFHGIASKPSHNIRTLRNLKVLANHPLRKSPQRLFGY